MNRYRGMYKGQREYSSRDAIPYENDVPVEEETAQVDIPEKEEKNEKEDRERKTKGEVVNCTRVNVRVSPKSDAPIASIILAKEVVDVILDNKSKDYYHVITDHNIEGYIKKDFLKI